MIAYDVQHFSTAWHGDYRHIYREVLMRHLTPEELSAILVLASEIGSDEQREQMLSDLSRCTVSEETPDASILMFHIEGYERPRYKGQDTFRGRDGFPVEGVVEDADGADVAVVIYVVDGRIFELELIRLDGKDVIGPVWSTLTSRWT